MDIHSKEIDFLATVSHDLKSPLNAILGTLDMIKHDIKSGNWNTENLLYDLSNAEQAGFDMLKLVQNMLTTSRIQADKENVVPYMISRSQLIEKARVIENTFSNEARCKKIDFSVFVGKLPDYVYWDMQKIRLFAINNLISNSLKLSGDNGGIVKVMIEQDQDDVVQIWVMDNGPGIPKNERSNIFCKYVSASNNTRTFQSSGFGLFNAHQTITMHHGCIEVLDGLDGKGVTFRIKIPANPFATPEANLTALSMRPSSSECNLR